MQGRIACRCTNGKGTFAFGWTAGIGLGTIFSGLVGGIVT